MASKLDKKQKINKGDISSPLQDFKHLAHIGPEYEPNHQNRHGGTGTLPPAPCRGNVKETLDSIQTRRAVGPEEVFNVNESKLNKVLNDFKILRQTIETELLDGVKKIPDLKVSEVEKEVGNLTQLVVTLMDKSELIENQFATLHVPDGQPNSDQTFVQEKDRQKRNGLHMGTESDPGNYATGTDDMHLYENTAEGVVANENRHDRVHVNDKASEKINIVYGNTTEGLPAREPHNIDTGTSHGTFDNDKICLAYSSARPDDTVREACVESQIGNSITNPMYPVGMGDWDAIECQPPSTQLMAHHTSGERMRALPASPHTKADERECISEALRANIVDIVENVLFRESELPDELTADGCITEDECDIIRNLSNRKDQIRVLLSAIRGRDHAVLVMFLKRVERANPDVAKKIMISYDIYKQNKVRPLACQRCRLVARVNLRYVCDSLLAVQAISDTLYNEIIFDSKPAGAQQVLWNRVIDSLNALQHGKHRKLAIDQILSVLVKKNYRYIYSDIQKHMRFTGKLPKCQCIIQPGVRGSDPVDYWSPRSSSEVSRDSKEMLSNTECKTVVEPGAAKAKIKSPERERRCLANSRTGSYSDEDVLKTISENDIPTTKEVQQQIQTKPIPKKRTKPSNSGAENASFV